MYDQSGKIKLFPLRSPNIRALTVWKFCELRLYCKWHSWFIVFSLLLKTIKATFKPDNGHLLLLLQPSDSCKCGPTVRHRSFDRLKFCLILFCMLKVPIFLIKHLVFQFLNMVRLTLCHFRVQYCSPMMEQVNLMTWECSRGWYKNLSVSAAASRNPERVLYVRLCHHLRAGRWGASVNLSSFQLSAR